MNDSYFYCYSLPLEVGSIIKPGNWGRILKTYTPQSSPDAWLLVRELIMEQIRAISFRDKPSRFDSVFLCHTVDDIINFKNSTSRHLDIVYEV